MVFRRFQIHYFSYLAAVTALLACSGMSPGGGPSGAVGDSPASVGNSLDGGNSGGGLPVGDASGGAAVPSTQQSTDNIGGGCVASYSVKVKVLHYGSEESCSAAATTYRINTEAAPDTEGGVLAPPETDGPPKVTLTIIDFASETQVTACTNGQWVTAEPIFFRAPCVERRDISVQATWQHNGKSHISNTFTGSPSREPGNYDPIPVEVTIDLGGESPDFQRPRK